MNTINFEEHNRLDDLRIQQAISGLSDSETAELERLEKALNLGEQPFNDYDKCVALVDMWVANESGIGLDPEQTRQAMVGALPFLKPTTSSPDRHNQLDTSRKRKRSLQIKFWSVSLSLVAGLMLLTAVTYMTPATDKPSSNVTASAMRAKFIDQSAEDMLRWQWMDPTVPNPVSVGDIVWSDLLQHGFALLNMPGIEDPAVYQLLVFEDWDDHENQNGVLCAEFRFDTQESPFVLMLRPLEKINDPMQFIVRRQHSQDEPLTGPNANQAIRLVAEAEKIELAESTDPVDPTENALISSEPATTF